jgi:hypothetical protein
MGVNFQCSLIESTEESILSGRPFEGPSFWSREEGPVSKRQNEMSQTEKDDGVATPNSPTSPQRPYKRNALAVSHNSQGIGGCCQREEN